MLTAFIISCAKSEDDVYVPLSPVSVDLTRVPYQKLSDYHFFDGDMKYQKPSLDVLPFEPASTLFTDYVHKKRFVWMPKGSKANFNGNENILELPVGAALIKTFYYDNVQPNNTTQIIETRVMIRKQTGWIFANYVWNAEQSEATLDLAGSNIGISWKDENNIIKNTNYRIPSEVECAVCHKKQEANGGTLTYTNIPIGIKPQNLNFNYVYNGQTKNQLIKWIEKGYLTNDFNLPSSENTTIDWKDTSKPLELRVRSYLDINCAHCHNEKGHCYYRPMLLDFKSTGLPNGLGLTNIGVCVNTQDMQGFPPALNKIITPGNINRSMMYYRMNTTNESYRMPLHGRTLIHQEAIPIIEQWINSLQPCQ